MRSLGSCSCLGSWKRGTGLLLVARKEEASSLATLVLRSCSNRSFGLNIDYIVSRLGWAPTLRHVPRGEKIRRSVDYGLKSCNLQKLKSSIIMSLQTIHSSSPKRTALYPPGKMLSKQGQFAPFQKVDFYQTPKVDNCPMEDIPESEQFSFWSHEASQGSCRGTARRPPASRPLKKTALETRASQYADTKTSSKNERKRLAGLRSREKKKSYVGGLEERVKQLDQELQEVEREIARCKDSLLEAIRTSNNNANQHASTYAQLERNAVAEQPDLDRINLLIDLIKARVGADGRERQAKLDYNFKQIINSIFPASYRYLLNTAYAGTDVFAMDSTPETLASNPKSWISELYQASGLELWQMERVRTLREGLIGRRNEAIALVVRLLQANQALKRQEEKFERKLGDFREDMSAIQVAKMLLFAEKNKLRKEFALCTDPEEPRMGKRVKME